MPEELVLNLHAVLPVSGVNGPGKRMVVFFQGCLRNCPGCFNQESHRFEERILVKVPELLDENITPGIEGITVSGGEPFMQPDGLARLLRAASLEYGLSTIVYTGFAIEEIREDPDKAGCLAYIDVLVDGPYDRSVPETTLLARGSRNQRLHFLTSRYSMKDMTLPGKAEIVIDRDGTVRGTGFSMISFPAELR